MIIGRLIPARIDRSEEGKKKLGIDQLGPRVSGVLTGTTEAPPTFEEALKVLGATEADLGMRAAAGAAALAGEGGRGDDGLAAAAAALRGNRRDDGDEEASLAAESLIKSTSGDAGMLNFGDDNDDEDTADDEE